MGQSAGCAGRFHAAREGAPCADGLHTADVSGAGQAGENDGLAVGPDSAESGRVEGRMPLLSPAAGALLLDDNDNIIGPFGMLALGLSQGQVDSRVLARGEVDNSGILPSIHARRCASCRAMQNFAN